LTAAIVSGLVLNEQGKTNAFCEEQMTAGRKPKPASLKLITGNPGKHPLNKNEPNPKREIPPCPDFLQGEARKTWHKVAKKLFRIGLLTELDDLALDTGLFRKASRNGTAREGSQRPADDESLSCDH
jgi:hypothetical protein